MFVFAGAAYRLNSAKKDSIELQLCLATLLTSLDSRSVSSVFTFVDKEEKEKSDKPWIETVQQILNCAIFRLQRQAACPLGKEAIARGWVSSANKFRRTTYESEESAMQAGKCNRKHEMEM